jgi:hypothetical protein
MSVVNIATNRDNPQQQHGFFTMQLTSPMGFRFFSAFGWSSWHMPPRNTMAQRRFAGEHVERFTRRRGGGTGCARATEVAQGRSEATGRVRYLHRDRDHVADLLLPASETSRPHMSRYFLGEDPPKVRVFRRRPRLSDPRTPPGLSRERERGEHLTGGNCCCREGDDGPPRRGEGALDVREARGGARIR